MSYPGPSWRIRGASNFRSQGRPSTNPRRAGAEWLALADAIAAAGGRVLVMPPPALEPPLTGLIYTANAGTLLGNTFLVSSMWASHRVAEREPVEAFARKLGLATERAQATWEGQAEVCTLPGNRYILSYGVRSVHDSVAEVRSRLPAGARTLEVKLRDPFFHGDTCLDAFDTPRGPVLLACAAALVDRSLDELKSFASGVEVIPVDEADALGYACNALAVGGRFLAPHGLSEGLLRQLADRGLSVVDLELGELFGKGGGGPRCLVNALGTPALGAAADAHRLDAQHAQIAERMGGYPEQAPTTLIPGTL